MLPIDQPVDVRAGEELPAGALQPWLDTHAPQVGQISSIRQFPSGFSNLTYALTATGGEFILRKPPAGANIKSAHDMGREFRVLSLLFPHFNRVPKPVALCEDVLVIGSSFYVMERLNGIILRASHARSPLPRQQFMALSRNLVDTLVEIHALNIQTTGLATLGKPEGYVARQVEGWTQRYTKAETDSIPAMNESSAWLIANQPVSKEVAFLHNDFKYDNVVLDVNDPTRIIGILDWEMATVGDPLMDLGAALAYWCEPTDHPLTRMFNVSWLPGNLSRKEVIDRYATGSRRDVSNISFYYVFGLFKNAVIAQQIYARWKAGFTQDPRFGQLIDVVKALAAHAVHAIETKKI
ncbi:MAG TPA: phosphotransferase family protein [Cytophagales bacterium]|nr:phosphotransferase family protein [Cytophagales bacterium]